MFKVAKFMQECVRCMVCRMLSQSQLWTNGYSDSRQDQCSQMRWFLSTCADFEKKISNDADLRADSKILLILLLLFGKNTKNSVVRYNMIKICLLKNKLIPNENNTDSRKSIRHIVTTESGTRGLKRWHGLNIKLYRSGKLYSFLGWTLPKIRIIPKKTFK